MSLSSKFLGLAFLVGTSSLSAAVISGNLNESLDLPFFNPAGPRIINRTGIGFPSAGPQLTSANQTSNPSGWSNMLNVTFNSGTNVISLIGDGANTYQIITLVFSNLVFDNGDVVLGITPVSTNNAVTGTFNLTTSFTANSVTIQYSVANLAASGVFNIGTQAADTFQIQVGPSAGGGIPEPSTYLLAGLGLAAIACFRRK